MTHALLRRLAVTLTAVGVVSGLGLGSAGAAQASASPAAQDVHVHSVPVRAAAQTVTLRPREDHDFPTWVFGTTRLCVTSTYSSATARVQSWAPWAAPEYISVRAGQTRCVDRWWGGLLVNVMNLSRSSSLTVTAR